MDVLARNFDLFYDVESNVLGRGRFSVVRGCTDRRTGDRFVAKFIKKGCRSGSTKEDIEREVTILKELGGSEHIIKLRDVFEREKEVILVLEFVPGGELFDYVLEQSRLPEDQASEIIRQLLLALKQMHDKCIAHLDLKPENIMLSNRKEVRIKLVDFGLSRKIVPGNTIRSAIGTIEFFAPEQVNFDPLSLATDMWAVGVIGYNLLSGASPFLGENRQETLSNISAVSYTFDDEYFSSVSDIAKDFIARLLVKNPRKRPTVEDCLRHPWIESGGLNKGSQRISIDQKKNSNAAEEFCNLKMTWEQVVRMISYGIFTSMELRNGLLPFEGGNSADISDSSTIQVNLSPRAFAKRALFRACAVGDLRSIEKLLSLVHFDLGNVTQDGGALVHLAASVGQLNALAYLTEKHADLNMRNKDGECPLHIASRNGHWAIVQYLLRRNAEVNARNKVGKTSLLIAASHGHMRVAKLLLRCPEVDVHLQDVSGSCLLHICCQRGDTSLVAMLCSMKVNLNMVNKAGQTPLHLAAMYGHVQCALLLIAYGCRCDVKNNDGKTALHLALAHSHMDVVRELVTRVKQPNDQDKNGDSALHLAAREGILSAVLALCEGGADTRQRNKKLMTPLHLAAAGGHELVVKALCYHGADANAVDKNGLTVRGVARKKREKNVREILKNLKGDQSKVNGPQRTPFSSCDQVDRIRVNVFGMSEVGKTRLIEALGSAACAGVPPSSMNRRIVPKPSPSPDARLHPHYTRCVEVHNSTVAGCGEVSFWEFSGVQSYYCVYDLFIRCIDCVHMIVFRATDPAQTQKHDMRFWLTFLLSCVSNANGADDETWNKSKLLPVIFVATCEDDSRSMDLGASENLRQSLDITRMVNEIAARLSRDLTICDSLVLVNFRHRNIPGIKLLQTCLANWRQIMLQERPSNVGFLEAPVQYIQSLRVSKALLPVIPWMQLVSLLRKNVNPRLSEVRCKHLMKLLLQSGQLLYIKSCQVYDMVILSPNWLGQNVLGRLLAPGALQTSSSRGIVTHSDIRVLFPDVPDIDQLIQLLEAFNICASLDVRGIRKYEFPVLNCSQRREKVQLRQNENVKCVSVSLLPNSGRDEAIPFIFPKVQVNLRRWVIGELHSPDTPTPRLTQWRGCSRVTTGESEVIVSAFGAKPGIVLQFRGSKQALSHGLSFFRNFGNVIQEIVHEAAPGITFRSEILRSAVQSSTSITDTVP